MTKKTEQQGFENPAGPDVSQIKGWGIDADPKNDPTYPMKKRDEEIGRGYSWQRPPQQPLSIEVLQSIERPNITAIFGTSVPPSGLSGKMRRKAFEYSENSNAHWMPLIMADRVNMIEGIVEDLKNGTIPNLFKELGWTAEWKYNRKNFLIKSSVIAGTAAFLLFLGSRRKCKSDCR
jgi:hypothetical protein